MRICILSDLHCRYQSSSGTPSDSCLISNKARQPVLQHPVAAFLQAAEKDANIKFEILICPGDLGDKADDQGIMSGWAFLEEIKTKLGAEILIGIPGNHDIKSREEDGKAFDFIKTFHEFFPTADSDLNNQFWEEGYCIVQHRRSLILLVNTVHDHVNNSISQKSNLSLKAIQNIPLQLDKMSESDFDYKICVMHHHPVKHSNISNWTDSDSVEKGDNLVAELQRRNFNIVIHGHKHQPRILEYNALPILAAGSFASVANLQNTGINLMFHIVELEEKSKMGKVLSWEYDVVSGWTQKLNKLFPPVIGFGASETAEQIAQRISEYFEANESTKHHLYDDVLKAVPQLQYAIPDKLIQVDGTLLKQFKIQTVPAFPLKPEIFKLIP